MKIKQDFVTNSSSASFVMTFVAKDKDLEDFYNEFSDFIEYYKKSTGEKLIFWVGTNIKQIADGEFQVIEWTPMYNDIGDIPNYMQYIMVDHLASTQSALECRGIKFKSFDIEDEGLKE